MREPGEKGVMDATESLRAWSDGDEAALEPLVVAKLWLSRELQGQTRRRTSERRSC